ncbi:rhodanese-like domain-containing protein [Cellulosilyticum sp. I15G10I2]|uniref:rhodanese-like domain-containing protein n=1 Tax=Cellulosilyticum sp. I15G10I2 TaxID=1892843 RepID=UPI0009F430EE|nr:rhodanese-like domain-containing protein [Cellulosilyticum sp. I15G10I2]
MKKNNKLLILFMSTLLVGCGTNSISNSNLPENTDSQVQLKSAYQKLDQSTAKQNLDTNDAIILVDVRTPEEFEEVRIPNSILLPDYDITKRAPELLPDQDSLIYLYCRSGRRSQEAAERLLDMGYTNVYDIGGIIDWRYETVTGGE